MIIDDLIVRKMWRLSLKIFNTYFLSSVEDTEQKDKQKRRREERKRKAKRKDVTESRNPHLEFNYIFFVNHRKASAGTACHIVKIARVSGMLYTNVLFSDSWRDLRLFLDQPVTP